MNDIEQIELSMDEARKLVAKGDALTKLMNNREFKKIITDGYFNDEAVRLVSVSADPALKNYWDEIQSCISGISHLQQYLKLIGVAANMAKQTMDDLESERDFIENGDE